MYKYGNMGEDGKNNFVLTGTLSDVKASNKTLISLETKSAALHNEEHLV